MTGFSNMFFGVCVAVTLVGASQVYAQTGRQDDNRLLGECRSLFVSGSYGRAGQLIDRISEDCGLASVQEIDYMKAVIAAKNDIVAAKPLLESFLQKYGDSAYNDRILAYYGEACLATHDFGKALEAYDECNMLNLVGVERNRADMNYAIALYRNGLTAEGDLQLSNCSENCPEDMKEEWLFYKAYSYYQNGRYEDARSLFALFLDSHHQQEARLYLAQMAVQDGKRSAFDVLDMKGLVEAEGDSEIGLEAMRILGEDLLGKGDSKAAADILLEYIDRAGDMVQPRDRYQAGTALYETQQWDAVIDCLAPVTEGNGEIAQSAALYMGLSALNNGDSQMARMSFQRAWQIPGRDDVREQALYNYSMLLHESEASPFGDEVQAMETFLNDYPSSPYADRIMQCLTQEYECTKNYDAALASISRIKNPGTGILASKQKLLMKKAWNEYNEGKFENAVSLFTDAMQTDVNYASRNCELLFWRGESYYRLGKYDKAERDWNRCLSTGSANGRTAAMAYYGLGYSAFNRGSYSTAANRMQQALAVKGGLDRSFTADAYLRLADCQLNLKQYSNALATYQKVMSMNSGRNDYVLSKCAVIYGLMQRNSDKIACLQRLTEEYPQSQYVPQALFDMGTTYQQTGNSKNAINCFMRVVKSYPTLDLSRRAAVETALAYYRMDDYDNARKMYSKVIEDYPGSAEARTAMADLRSLYVEQGDAASFIAYTQKMGGASALAPDQQDSLSYAAAESVYGRGDTETALRLFNDYLTKYPAGAFAADARYYSAVIYEKNNDYDRAIDNYLEAAGVEGSRFSTDALSNAAALAYSVGDWETSMDLYVRLYRKASDPGLRETCAERTVLSAGRIEEHEAVLEFYDAAVKGGSPQHLSDMKYYRVKALLAGNDKGRELKQMLEELSKDTRSQNGAECDYLLSQLLYDQGNAAKAQDNIMELMAQGTPHLYWLSRSLILLSDILEEQGKNTEARQYLLSLKANYTENDDIAGMIEDRLKK